MNGENHWAKEWGVGFIRSSSAFADGHGMHHPADCYGDTGAAAGPLMAALAALAIAGRAHGSPVLVYGSSDRGERAALMMTA
jgi:3-oxoacyl-[acyl-carrier-protein] synthase-1